MAVCPVLGNWMFWLQTSKTSLIGSVSGLHQEFVIGMTLNYSYDSLKK